jgi:non-ribosomal peptide synthetase component F
MPLYKYLKKVGEARSEDGKVPSAGPIYKSTLGKVADGTEFESPISTLYENFEAAVKRFPTAKCLGVREGSAFQFQTYQEVHALVKAAGCGLRASGVLATGRVGIYGGDLSC